MKECGEIGTYTTFKDTKELYDWLKQEYISKPLTCELLYSGGLFALVSVDQHGNYKACEIILDVLSNKIRGYQVPTAKDEMRIMEFYGLN